MPYLNTSQVKVTFPNELYFYLKSRASRFGLPVSSYLKHLAISDVSNLDLPTFKMSEKTERVALQALKEHRQGKTHQINDIDEFLNSL